MKKILLIITLPFIISFYSCSQSTNQSKSETTEGKVTKPDTLIGKVEINQKFTQSHFVQLVDGNTTILEVTLHDHQPEGVKDGGERITFYTQILKPDELEINRKYSISSKGLRNRLELVFDPGYDSYEAKDLEGCIEFLKIDENKEYLVRLTVKEKDSEKFIAIDKLILYNRRGF